MIRQAWRANARAVRLTARWVWLETRTRAGIALLLSMLLVAVGLIAAWEVALHEQTIRVRGRPVVGAADHAGVVLIVCVLCALVLGMMIETEDWRPATYGFIGLFVGLTLLYLRVWMGIRGERLLQSNTALWACRGSIIASAAYLFGIVCYRLMTRRIDWPRAVARIIVLLTLLAMGYLALAVVNGGTP